jgi:hypothetical protein
LHENRKGRAAATLGEVPPDEQQQQQNKSGAGAFSQLWYVLFGFPNSVPVRVFN